MSDATDAGRIDILAGFQLSKPRLGDYGTLEKYFEQNHIASMLAGARAAGVDISDALQSVNLFLRTKPYAYGTRGFQFAIQSPGALPAALWMCLRVKQPKVDSMSKAEDLLTADNWENVQAAVLELFGFTRKPDLPKNPPAGEATASHSPSTISPPASDQKESAPPISQTSA